MRTRLRSAGWVALAGLAGALWLPELMILARSWRSDGSVSHGPIILGIGLLLLWLRRRDLRPLGGSTAAGLVAALGAALGYLLSAWTDFEFAKPVFLLLVAGCLVWYLAGARAARAAAAPLGFLVFMVPCPTTLVERVAFPLQMTSSAYAALLGGIIGLPIQREGVQLFVVPDLAKAPVYSILVAQKCSGLTSLTVLLALAYLIAYFTPAPAGVRAVLMGAVVPLALVNNALRLTFVLVAGAYQSRALAQWVHDHEAPVLVLLCTLGLLALRAALLRFTGGTEAPSGSGVTLEQPSPAAG